MRTYSTGTRAAQSTNRTGFAIEDRRTNETWRYVGTGVISETGPYPRLILFLGNNQARGSGADVGDLSLTR